MVAAATAAVAWERYGPKGCRLHEFEAARSAAAEARFNDQDTSETQQDGE
jgi:hypothetical protein